MICRSAGKFGGNFSICARGVSRLAGARSLRLNSFARPGSASVTTFLFVLSSFVTLQFLCAIPARASNPSAIAPAYGSAVVSPSTPKKVIIDTDPGTDDAIAIMLALTSPELDVRALNHLPPHTQEREKNTEKQKKQETHH